MSLKKRMFLVFLSIFMIFSTVIGCSKEKAPETLVDEGQYAEELIVTVAAAPTTLDPNESAQNVPRRFICHMYETLLKFDMDSMTIKPWLAESWEQPGPKEYIFHLRENVKFHNGEILTAEDVKYTYERCLGMAGALPYVNLIDTIEVIDELTLKLILKEPSPIFLNNLTHEITSIIRKDEGDTIAEQPNGTSAYKMVEHRVDDYVLLERFDDYWGGVKPTKFIRMRIIPDNNARNLAVEAKDVHIGILVTNADYTFLQRDPNIDILDIPTNLVEYFCMNVTKPPFDDVHARRAVAYAFNKQEVVDGIYEGDALNAKSLINISVFGYDPNVDCYEYNVDKAKEELAKSKYPDGFDFKCYTTASRGKYTEALQYDLSLIGINMEVEFVQNVSAAISAGYEGACIASLSYPSYDPDPLYKLLHSGTHGASGNLAFYSNPIVDELLEKSQKELDVDKREQIFKEIQQIAYEDIAYLPILTKIVKTANVRGVGGFKPDPGTIDKFYDAYLIK